MSKSRTPNEQRLIRLYTKTFGQPPYDVYYGRGDKGVYGWHVQVTEDEMVYLGKKIRDALGRLDDVARRMKWKKKG